MVLLISIEMRHFCHQIALVIALELVETPKIIYLTIFIVNYCTSNQISMLWSSIGVYGYGKSTDKPNVSSHISYCPLVWMCHSRKSNYEIIKVHKENSEMSMVIIILVFKKSFRNIIM